MVDSNGLLDFESDEKDHFNDFKNKYINIILLIMKSSTSTSNFDLYYQN